MNVIRLRTVLGGLIFCTALLGCSGTRLSPETGSDTQPPQSEPALQAVNLTATPSPSATPAQSPGQVSTVTLVPSQNSVLSTRDVVTSADKLLPAVPTPDSPALQSLLAQAQDDLGTRTSVNVGQIELVSMEPVVWPDGSLGCPQPDMAYPQVQVEGMLIQLRINKQIYNYHSGGNRPPFLCETDKTLAGQSSEGAKVSENQLGAGPTDPALRKLAARARADLASRLVVPVEQIEILTAEQVIWPDSGLGCPQPGIAYQPVQEDGVRIRLRVAEKIYTYHSSGNHPPFLCETPAQDADDTLLPPPGFND